MSRLVLSVAALADIDRLCEFLMPNLLHEAMQTAGVIADGLEILEKHPGIGRPMDEGLRELVISRGRTGYVAQYLYDEDADMVLVMAVRHQRESGYETH